ncbi:putative histidine triad-like protein [Diaporthe ampelina]|uniref:Acyl-coenzyme A diphosphatase SCS3 n=1 Tax=Diaporthe ampelina TaxID=1214573 RepID=A0A0G2HHA1_9PEZI|nr:putative histidine triad-like protein [Diaporthe ampelina]
MTRNPPFLPTPLEAAALLLYPIILTFGTLFSLLSPQVRNAPYFPALQAHSQDPGLSPSYFARKSNVFNVYFVKRGWAWVSLAFFVFVFTHPAVRTAQQKTRALARWGLVTTWWVLVTQWCFGPALIDRSFLFTGGRCEIAEAKLEAGAGVSGGDIFTAVACRTAGGRWRGGHDISGHVFLLVLGSFFLLQEVGWVYLNHWKRRAPGGVIELRDERSVIMHDGAVKSATVEGERDHSEGREAARPRSAWEALALGGKLAGGVFVLSLWMILMTAIFFHTWIEKLTGLLVASAGLMSAVKVPANLPELVRAKFNTAKANGDVNFYPTQVAVLKLESVPFQLRFSPSLANKPKGPPPASTGQDKKARPFNPFEDPPPTALVSELQPDHRLVLNKFAVVPEHSILVTRTFKQQTHLLAADDLAAAHACIRAYHEHDGRGLFVFFNSGEHSGASQPHRHLQLLPVESMREGLPEAGADGGAEAAGWTVLADRLAGAGGSGGGGGGDVSAELPLATFAERIAGDAGPEALRSAYIRLYRRACAAAGLDEKGLGDPAAGDDVPAEISYNLGMTRTSLVVCPRVAEGDVVRSRDGKEVGRLALNGTVLAGTALVKSEAEWDALRADPGQLWDILGKVGCGTR